MPPTEWPGGGKWICKLAEVVKASTCEADGVKTLDEFRYGAFLQTMFF